MSAFEVDVPGSVTVLLVEVETSFSFNRLRQKQLEGIGDETQIDRRLKARDEDGEFNAVADTFPRARPFSADKGSGIEGEGNMGRYKHAVPVLDGTGGNTFTEKGGERKSTRRGQRGRVGLLIAEIV